MRVECPNCKAGGNVNDHTIPDEGMNLTCPKCKTDFHVDKPRKKMTSPYATNTCPSCGYSTFCEEVFDECPHCGMDVKAAIEQKRKSEAQKRERELRNAAVAAPVPPAAPVLPPSGLKYSTPAAPEPEKIKINLATFAEGFNPVAAIGWGAALLALALLITGGSGLSDYLGTDIQAKLSENSLEPVSAWKVFWGYGFMPWVEVILGVVLLIVAFLFLQRHPQGLPSMTYAVQAALLLVPVYEVGKFVVWIVNSISPPWWGYLVEFFSTLLVTALVVVPLWFLLQYLDTDRFSRDYKKVVLPPIR